MNVLIKEAQTPAEACVIWMHGLGADASDMMGLAEQLAMRDIPLRHVFLNAPQRPVTLNGGMIMPAWYDIFGMELIHREDHEGIGQSEKMIRQVMNEQLDKGFAHDQIFLAGFSQGGAMALHTALHTTERLAGVVALSAYLPLANHTQPKLDKDTPFFMGAGHFDPLVLPQWTEASKDWIALKGYEHISFYKYPMEHSICFEELNDLSLWFKHTIRGES